MSAPSLPGFSKEALDEGIFQLLKKTFAELTPSTITGADAALGDDKQVVVSQTLGPGVLDDTTARTVSKAVAYEVHAVILSFIGEEKTDVTPQGAIDGINATFTLPHKFIHDTNGKSIRVYRNGLRLTPVNDYTVSESGGLDTGFDTIVLLVVPIPGTVLRVDYARRWM